MAVWSIPVPYGCIGGSGAGGDVRVERDAAWIWLHVAFVERCCCSGGRLDEDATFIGSDIRDDDAPGMLRGTKASQRMEEEEDRETA